MEEKIRTFTDLRSRRLLRRADVVKTAGKAGQDAASRPTRKKTAPEAVEGELDRRQLDSPDRARDAAPRHPAGQHAFDVGRLLDLEAERGHIRGRCAARRDNKITPRKIVAGFERGVGILEAVSENQVEVARGEIAEGVVEVGGRGGLHRRDLRAELTRDQLQAVVSGGVPARVADRTRRQEGDAKGYS